MAEGITRREQWALIGIIGMLMGVFGVRALISEGDAQPLGIQGQGQWTPLGEFAADPQNASGLALAQAPGSGSQPGGLDLNLATAADLERLPGIGPAKAAAIIETRARLGGFASVDQLVEVPGIGEKTLERFRPFLKVTGPVGAATASFAAPPAPQQSPAAPTTPPQPAVPLPRVNLNTATAAELATLEGIGPIKAEAIIDDRVRNGPFSSPQDLTRVSGIGPKTLEKNWSRITVQP